MKSRNWIMPAVLAACFFSTAALADDAKPKAPAPPSCGADAATCQKVVDALQAQIAAKNAVITNYKYLLTEANDRAAGDK